MRADDIRLWRMAMFDVLVNSADRKGGQILRDLDGHIYPGPQFGIADESRIVARKFSVERPVTGSVTTSRTRCPNAG